MKIDNSVNSFGALSYRKLDEPAAAKTEQAAEQDSVNINPLVAGALKDESAFDAEKVAQISQAIAEGRFSVNPEKIADGLLSSVKELLAR